MTTTLSHRYEPRGVCRELFEIQAPEVLLAGPAGTGKTRAALEKLHALAAKNPNARCLMVRKTQVSLTSTALVTWKRDVIPESVEAGLVKWYGGSREEPAQYRYSNGSAVVLGGLDKDSRIMSSEWDVIYVNEATELTESDWEALSSRLRSNVISFQQLIADCNPDSPTHWLFKRAGRGLVMLNSVHEDNPTLFTDEGEMTDRGVAYMERLDNLTGTRYQRLRLGKWVGVEGTIYPEYNAALHLIDPYPIPDDLNRYWVCDFGFVHPFVCQQWAELPDGELVMYREFYGTRKLVSEWAAEILDVVTDDDGVWTEPRPIAVICDHDAEGREQFSRGIGQGVTPAIKRVSEGIDAVKARLKDVRVLFMREALHDPDQELQQSSLPICTVDEFGGYVWANHQTKEQPVKTLDDGMDCVRYMIAQRDLGARPGVRFM